MRFGLTAIFYVTAVIGAAIAAFSPCGILLAALVILFWGFVFSAKSWKGGLGIGAQVCAVGLCLVCCTGLLLPAIGKVREPARMMQCSNQLRQIGLAINNYHYAHGSFPPAFLADEDGRPMHSWRVLILPYMEEKDLYDRYDFSEPWDGPNNSRLVKSAPFVYRCPSQGGGGWRQETSYVAIVGPNTMWSGAKTRDTTEIQNGAEQTLLVVEAQETNIHWMEPRDLSVEEFVASLAEDRQGLAHDHDSIDGYLSYSRCFNGVFADNHTARFDVSISRDLIEALTTVNDREKVSPDVTAGRPRRYWRWGRVISLSMFLVLVFLPAVRLPRHMRQGRTRTEAEAEARCDVNPPARESFAE